MAELPHISEVNGAIFDVDETLLKGGTGMDNTHERARLTALLEFACEYEELGTLTPEMNHEAFLSAESNTVEAAILQALRMTGCHNRPGLNVAELVARIFARKNQLHGEVLKKHAAEIDGAGDFVRSLGDYGVRMALASGSTRVDINTFLSRFDLKRYFPEDKIVAVEDTNKHKPHPMPFDVAFRTLGLPEADRATTLAFEDDPRGVISAKKAGLFVIGITTRFTRRQMLTGQNGFDIKPDHVTDSYAELKRDLGIKP